MVRSEALASPILTESTIESIIQLALKTVYSPPPRRLAALHQGALGDFLLACPVFEDIHRTFPGVVLDLWTREDHGDLLSSKPYLGRVASCHGHELTPFHHEDLWENAGPPARFMDVDQVLIFGQEGARRMSERLSRRLSRPVRWIQSFPGPDNPVHVTEFLRSQLCEVLGPLKGGFHRLSPTPEHLEAARSWLTVKLGDVSHGPVLVHPGSGGASKVWPLSRWYALLAWLRQGLSVPVVLTLGPADDRIGPLARAAAPLGVHVAEGFRLPGLAALLSQARLFLGSDSGVSHLASAVGVPTVVVFGNSDDRVWSPAGPYVHVVRDAWRESEVFDLPLYVRHSPDNEELKTIVGHLVGTE